MNQTALISKHLKDVYFGGNWTSSSLVEQLADVSWREAGTQVHSFNSIAALVYHVHYFVAAVITVLQGEPLTAKDKFSFDHPPIHSEADWEQLLQNVWSAAETCAALIEQLPESRLWEPFADEKYGNYYRNLHGVIEHAHYHLGQIVLVKKLLRQAIQP